MDRRSWWKKRSSEKNSGESESSGGSGTISISAERLLSDEQQVYQNQSSQSSEVTTKGVLQDEDANDAMKILTEKLSVALENIATKEESVNQHAKVAEEAVAGWEKAEKEANTVKQQLDVATNKNTTLEDRIAHLDEALKECLRQLRQVREDQDQKIQEAIMKKSDDSESNKSVLEAQVSDLRIQLEKANTKLEAAVFMESDLRLRLGISENENTSLQLELRSRVQELEIRTLERDLSTKTAETASKQNLESIKRVAKLDGECRRLKGMLRKATSSTHNDHKSYYASPFHAEDSFSDSGERSIDCGQSHSDTWASTLTVELDGFKHEQGNSKFGIPPSPEIGLMDDFLEMERLASFPVRDQRSGSLTSVTSTDKHTIDSEASLKAELETMVNRTAELEERVEMFEREKLQLGMTLAQSQNQLKISQAQFRDANRKIAMLQAELDLANELRQAIEMELEDANVRREEAESQVRDMNNDSNLLLSRVTFLEGESQRERSLYSELSRLKHEVETLQSQLTSTTAQKEVAESQLEAMESEVKSLFGKASSLEDEREKERCASKEFATKCRQLDYKVSSTESEVESLKNQLALANESKKVAEIELEMTNSKREQLDTELKDIHIETKSLLAKVSSLEREVEKERMLCSEFSTKCKKLEEQLSKMKHGSELRFSPFTKEELNIQQERELTVAASKLAECQNTISSLGNQLKSLAMLEDIFLESENLPNVSDQKSQFLENAVEIAGG